MIRIGLTGGLASGKSTVARMFQSLGAQIVSADDIVHQLYCTDRSWIVRIIRHFGPQAIGKSGKINRKAMARAIFANPKLKRTWERLIHPAVLRKMEAAARDLQHQGLGVVILEVPLLFEADRDSRAQAKLGLAKVRGIRIPPDNPRRYDRIIVVHAPERVRLRRVMNRYRVSPGEALQRIRSQISLKEKMGRADIRIPGFGPLAATRALVKTVWKKLISA